MWCTVRYCCLWHFDSSWWLLCSWAIGNLPSMHQLCQYSWPCDPDRWWFYSIVWNTSHAYLCLHSGCYVQPVHPHLYHFVSDITQAIGVLICVTSLVFHSHTAHPLCHVFQIACRLAMGIGGSQCCRAVGYIVWTHLFAVHVIVGCCSYHSQDCSDQLGLPFNLFIPSHTAECGMLEDTWCIMLPCQLAPYTIPIHGTIFSTHPYIGWLLIVLIHLVSGYP